MRNRQEELRIAAIVRDGFAHRPYPGDERLVTGSGIDSTSVQRDFRGRRWGDISLDDLFYNREGMFFMTPEAFAYYVPAFVLAALSDHEHCGDIRDTLVFALTPAPGEKHEERARSRLRQFSLEEKRALEEFLRYSLRWTRPDPQNSEMLEKHEDERRRLRTFWNID